MWLGEVGWGGLVWLGPVAVDFPCCSWEQGRDGHLHEWWWWWVLASVIKFV